MYNSVEVKCYHSKAPVLPNQSAWEIFQDKQGDQVTENVLYHPLFVYMPRKNSLHTKWNIHGGDKNLLWLRRLFHLSKQWGQTAGAISENDSRDRHPGGKGRGPGRWKVSLDPRWRKWVLFWFCRDDFWFVDLPS